MCVLAWKTTGELPVTANKHVFARQQCFLNLKLLLYHFCGFGHTYYLNLYYYLLNIFI